MIFSNIKNRIKYNNTMYLIFFFAGALPLLSSIIILQQTGNDYENQIAAGAGLGSICVFITFYFIFFYYKNTKYSNLISATKEKGGSLNTVVSEISLKSVGTTKPVKADWVPRQSRQGKRVLIANDDELETNILKEKINDLGYSTYSVNTGNEVSEVLKEESSRPDMVLLNTKMPEISGFAITEQLRKKYTAEELPVILIISNNQQKDIEKCFLLGANDYITKPFVLHELEHRVNNQFLLQAAQKNQDRVSNIDNDLLLTKKLRNNIIPKNLPEVTGLSLFLTKKPLDSAGGDYYDFLQNEPDKLGVLLCDFSRHGIAATVVTAMLKIAFEQQESLGDSPAHLMTQLNYVMADYLGALPVTATYAYFDLSENSLLYTNAGHSPLVIYRQKERRSIQFNMETKELGFNSETAYEVKKISFHSQDRVYMYCDGILESKNLDGEKFGLDRFLELVRDKAGIAASKVGDEIIRSLKKWTGNKEWPGDDITMLVIEID
ncbi:MAG: SpoIIE family protein phosphatase [Leptospirales bacterium]